MTVGLFVADPLRYAEYRAEIAPLLAAAGGGFRYDFEVARTLKSEAGHELNRVFVIRFPSRASMELFFADAEYVEIRARLFVPAVLRMEMIAEYEV
jgi:uncharacterized protein (DUF1330 family)